LSIAEAVEERTCKWDWNPLYLKSCSVLNFLVNGRDCGVEDLEVGLDSLIPGELLKFLFCGRGCGGEDLEVGLEFLIPGELLNFLVCGRGCGGEDLEVGLNPYTWRAAQFSCQW
jgi:hypothetical protein